MKEGLPEDGMMTLSNRKRAENWLLDLEMWKSLVVLQKRVSIQGRKGGKKRREQMVNMDNSLGVFAVKENRKKGVRVEGGGRSTY